jgi:hypothetical protein
MLTVAILGLALQVSASRAVLVADLDRLNQAYWRCDRDCSAIRARIDRKGEQLVTGDLGYTRRDRETFRLLTTPAWQQPAQSFRIPAGVLKLIPMWRRK